MRTILVISAICLCFYSQGQNSFRKFLGVPQGYANKAIDMSKSPDGGFYVLESRLFEKDNTCTIILSKLNALGDSVWSLKFNGNQLNSEATAMYVNPDNGNVLVAYQQSVGAFSDTRIALVNNSGSIHGDTIYSLNINEFEDVSSITKSHDGGFVLSINAGKKNETYSGYLVKIKSDFNIDWKMKDSTTTISKVIYHSSGSYVCVGAEKMARYNLFGNKLWEKSWPNISFNSLSELSDSSIIAVCQGVSMQMITVSPLGKEILKKDFSGSGSPAIYPIFYAISESADKKLLLAGSNNAGTAREYFFAKTDKNGNIEWRRTFYGPTVDYVNRFVAITSLSNKGIALLAKYDNTEDGYDDRSAFYVTDSMGIVRKLSIDKEVFKFDKPIYFDDGKGGKGSITFSQLGSLKKLNINLYVDSITQPSASGVRFIKRFADIQVDSASGFKAEMNFPIYQDELNGIQPGALSFQRYDALNSKWSTIDARSITPSIGTSYIANLKQITQFSRWTMGWSVNSVEKAVTKNAGIHCYPNPGNGLINLQFTTEIPQVFKVQILDLRGSVVIENDFIKNTSGTVQINTEQLLKGSYFVKIIAANNVSVLKYICD